ncbi:MAG: hypothetical protein K5745_01095 [Saccharofermentans sp.]|nr:hypothetical protein [Saccharofermentans sp.]
MKKYMQETLDQIKTFIGSEMDSASPEKTRKVLAEFEKKIAYFQHERLIHLIVTFFFALFLLFELYCLFALDQAFMLMSGLLTVIFFVLTIAYVFHYYFLENTVQEMYKLRDQITRHLDPDIKV